MLHRPPPAIALALAVLALAAGAGCDRLGASIDGPSATPTGPGEATVDGVVDGDTVRVRLPGRSGTESVRLIGVDTPETAGPGGLRECFGKEASARTAQLLPEGTEVRLVRDVEARDRYGRLLAYVYRRPDGLFVNLALAEGGFAAPLTIPPNVAHRDGFVAAAAAARDAGRGLWGRCGGPDTPVS
ncbi:MAG TPA: thermonuclease family protein [Acidimicrobiales bacterium]|nr:thermonuclease family protein [Acidimicrobiales bacterium]